MKAIVLDGTGERAVAGWDDVPDPELRSGDVLVEVHAAGVNRADLLQRAGTHPAPEGESPLLGLEASGVVSTLGRDVQGVSIGDEVCALLPSGGYAEVVRVPAPLLMPLPKALTFTEAAGLPEVFLTAYSALFKEGQLRDGETVLIHAGASGVGTAAIQLAKRAGCTVISTAGSERKVDACRRLGVDLAVNYKDEDFAASARNFTDDRGVDLILDFVGKGYFERNLDILAPLGRLVHIATLGGSEVALDIRTVMRKRLTITGATLRSRPHEEKVRLRDGFLARFGADLDSGVIHPVVDCVFPIRNVDEAHAYMRENRNIGKIILSVR